MNNNILLVFGLNFPEPRSTAAGTRMLQLIELFKDFGYEVHFACAQPKTEFSTDLESIGISVHSIHINDHSATLLLEQIQPQIVLFDRFITEEQFGWKADENCPHALKILDTEDLHFLREYRAHQLKQPARSKGDFTLTDKAKRELAAIYRCDITLMISTVEIDILVNTYNIPAELLVYIPFLIKSNNISKDTLTGFDARNHFISIGNFKHAPNLDMVKHLNDEIWPKIRQALPHAEWHIYGAYLPQQIEELHKPGKGIIVKGRAEEAIITLSNYKVMLAPLRFGAGLKGKCLDSMQGGTPSVTTTVGAEGIAKHTEWSGFVKEDVDEFCSVAIQLYQDEQLWEIKREQGFKILKACFDIYSFQSGFKTKVEQALDHLQSLRQQNIVGELLKHHHHRSTKFMSLWIEEKNR